MITTESGMVPCGCRSVGECNHNTFAEIKAFEMMVDKFAALMKTKFRHKWRQGRRGWDDPECAEGIGQAMIEHAKREGQEVDVANLAAMLWNFRSPASQSDAAGGEND